MHSQTIEQKKKSIIERYGCWTAHNIRLDGDIYTIGKTVTGDDAKLRRIVQIVSDISGASLDTLRILDLACLEGLYAVELARHGAAVVGIEGRESSIEKARFAKEVLGLENLQLLQDDVRNLSRAKHGRFDVVLCLGILYHLDSPDVFEFLASIAEVCQGFAIFHTHVALEPEVSREFGGTTYWGKTFFEHAPQSTPEERAKSLWASLDNVESFWPTRASLYNALSKAGFTSVYECHTPPEQDQPLDRITLLAMKGRRVALQCSPLINARTVEDVPETRAGGLLSRLVRRLRNGGALLPRTLKDLARRVRG